jgi:tRNA dimethylallyltransferase
VNTDPLFHAATYLTGPTASGKTAVGIALARRTGAEVLALDSMTLYRGLDIGTAKPTLEERQGVPHHLLDLLDPWESASVAWYRDQALAKLRDLAVRGIPALFVGGTPLYLKALLRGLFDGPAANLELRAALEHEALTHGDAALHGRLARLDPATAARLHPHDRRRVIRALEILDATGQRPSDLQLQHGQPAATAHVVALQMPRPALHRRIDARVQRMMAQGLVEEVRRLRAGSRPPGHVAAQAVGYHEVGESLEGRIDEPAAIARIQARTRQFARRQETWFRGLAEVTPFPIEPDEPAAAIADRLQASGLPGELRDSGLPTSRPIG